VKTSYGVLWQENDRPAVAGKLELDASQLRLEGSDAGAVAVYALPYHDLVGVHVGRESADRLRGQPALLLERSNGDRIRIAALTQAGIVAEIAERLATLESGPRAASA
jgi:hypothetical protein